MVNIYCRFIPNCARILQPLTNLLMNTKKYDVVVSGDTLSAFSKIKAALTKTTELSVLPDVELCLAVDTVAVEVGAVLQAIWFFPPNLTNTQKRYNTFGRELYAAYAAVRHFRHFLVGRRFYIFTDHKPLVGAFRSNSEKYSPREVKHLDYLLQFTSDIRKKLKIYQQILCPEQ